MSDACSVCYTPEKQWKGSTTASCGHSLCMRCFIKIIESKPSCPLCRKPFVEDDPVTNDELATTLNIIVPTIQRLPYIDRELIFEQHQIRVAESLIRRNAFLETKRQEFVTHYQTCTDLNCIKTHRRTRNWLTRGKLVPCPKPLSSLSNITLSLIVGHLHMGITRRLQLERLTIDIPTTFRINGFLTAVYKQQQAKQNIAIARQNTKGSVKSRIGTSLKIALENINAVVPVIAKSVKTFTGQMPPKRKARVGDIHYSPLGKGLCVGYHRWTYANGNTLVLYKGKWTPVPIT